MTTLMIDLSDEQLERLRHYAVTFGITVEELVRLSVTSLILQRDPEFTRAMDYVLTKNADLYRRLA